MDPPGSLTTVGHCRLHPVPLFFAVCKIAAQDQSRNLKQLQRLSLFNIKLPDEKMSTKLP